MASLKEIQNTFKKFKNKNIPIALLHCISSYPNLEENSYLINIKDLQKNLIALLAYLITRQILKHQYIHIF